MIVKKRDLVVAVLITFCLTAGLFLVKFTRSQTLRQYDPWLDINDDGKINIEDVATVARAFGTQGTNTSKASIDYDSGWINITDKCGQNIVITHNLNSTDLIVDIQGRRTANGGSHQILLGGAEVTSETGVSYGGTAEDVTCALVQTVDGGYTLAGYTASFGAGGWDFWLVKTDASGNMQWNKTYGGTGTDYAQALVQTGDGGYALAGLTTSFGAGQADAWLVKTDASGNMQWNKTYGGINDDKATALVQTGDGGYALAGYTYSFGAGSSDSWLVKTDASGNMQWNKTYGGTGTDYADALVQTADGGYALASATYSFGAGGRDSWLVKTDAAGNIQWNKTYGGPYDDEANALVQTGDGGYALAGFTASFGAGGRDAWLVRTDASGNMQWNQTYGGTNDDQANALVQTADGGYALAGYTKSFGAGGWDFWLVKADASGTMLWNRTYGGTNDDIGGPLVQTADGGYAIAGGTSSFGAGSYDFWLVKTDHNGEPQFMNYTCKDGLVWIDSTKDTITLLRGTQDTNWNFVRVRLWKPR